MMGFGEAVASFYKNYFNFDGRASRAEYWWPTLLRTLVYVASFYKNYFNFNGRASRAEYWWPVLMQAIVYIALIVLLVSLIGINSGGDDIDPLSAIIMIIIGLFWLANIIPGYSVAARRFHDLDQTGWLVLVFVIANAIVGITAFAQLIWFAMPGTKGHNQYGPDPYGSNADVFG